MRELRKLHLRWWHATKEEMGRALRAANIPQEILDLIPTVVNNCRECRKWQLPANQTIPTLRLSVRFNQHVEADIMFYKDKMIFHLICCASRWHNGQEIDSKHDSTLLAAIDRSWIQLFGAMEKLIVDGEGGMASEFFKTEMRRRGVEVDPRAPRQHARFIERRGAILRHALHTTEEQLEREGIFAQFDSMLANSIFAGNSLTHVGGVTPYNVVFGRQPHMLPPLEVEPAGEGAGGHATGPDPAGEPQPSRLQWRVREIALQRMIEATSIARVNRALRARTTASGEGQFRINDVVEIHRPSDTQDVSGWAGPGTITAVNPARGQVQVKYRRATMNCRLQDVRHFIGAIFDDFGTGMTRAGLAWDKVEHYIEHMKISSGARTFGHYSDHKGVHLTDQTRQRPDVLQALRHIAQRCFQLPDVRAFRLVRGQRHLGPWPGCTRSLVIWWFPEYPDDLMQAHLDGVHFDAHGLIGEDWKSARIMQLILGDSQQHLTESGYDVETGVDGHAIEPADEAASTTQGGSPSGLSVVPEGDESDFSGHIEQVMLAAWREVETTEDMNAELVDCNNDDMEMIYAAIASSAAGMGRRPSEWPQHLETIQERTHINEQCHYFLRGASLDTYATMDEHDDDGPHVELYLDPGVREAFMSTRGARDGHAISAPWAAVLNVYLATKTAVIKRDTDLLTKDEVSRLSKEVAAAILEELTIWVKYKCFERRPLKGARNVMDSRHVFKWKHKKTPDGKMVRIIRCRMALRGFRDMDAGALETFAGTAKRSSQRILSSEAACHPPGNGDDDWVYVAVDVEKAFLQGMTYEEMHEQGEPAREVNFTLPPGSAAILRQVPGYETFNEHTECLHCIKPGTGCKDAPRAFSMKLARVTRSAECNTKPTRWDPELEVKHETAGGHATGVSQLVMMLSKHVDDLKIAGQRKHVTKLIQHIEAVFGKMKGDYDDFTNCGVHQHRDPDGTVTLDQDEYIDALITIKHVDLVKSKSEEPALGQLPDLFVSLLGAAAYALITQHHLAVYIVALQRAKNKLCIKHVMQLNAVVLAMQKIKARIVYPAMKCNMQLVVHSDGSFKREEETGYGMRGAVYLRMGTCRKTGKEVCHLLDAVSRSHKLVCRSSFGSELLAACGAADGLQQFLLTLHELHKGPVTADEARRLREVGGYAIPAELVVDGMSVFSALLMDPVRPPSENSMAGHLWWLSDQLRTKQLADMLWCDTRDMRADPMTKGSIGRELILDVMRGRMHYNYDVVRFSAEKAKKAVPSSQHSDLRQKSSAVGELD